MPLITDFKTLDDTLRAIESRKVVLEDTINTLESAGKPIEARPFLQELQGVTDDYSQVGDAAIQVKKQISQSIRDGSYVRDFDPGVNGGTVEFTPDAIEERLKAYLSVETGFPADRIDLQSGAPGGDRWAMSFYEQQHKDDYLENKYGRNNVKKINIAGTAHRMINMDGKLVLVDEFGTSYKDFLDAGGEAIIIGGEIGAGIVAAGASGGAIIPVMTAVGGARLGLGVASDMTAKAVWGVGDTLGNSMGRRSVEAFTSMALEGVVGKGMQVVARKWGPGVNADAYRQAREAEAALNMTRGQVVDAAQLAQLSPTALKKAQKLAAKDPDSAIGRDFSILWERVAAIRKQALGEPVPEGGLYETTIKNQMHDLEQQEQIVRMFSPEAAGIMRKVREEMLYDFRTGTRKPLAEIGTQIHKTMQSVERHFIAQKNAAYRELYDKANAKGILVDPDEVVQVINKAAQKKSFVPGEAQTIINDLAQRNANAETMAKLQGLLDKGNVPPKLAAKYEAEIAELEAKSGPMDLERMNEYLARLRDSVPQHGTAGAGQADINIGDMVASFQQFRDNIIKSNGLVDDWRNVVQKQNATSEFTRNELGSFMKSQFDESSKTPEALVTTMFSSKRIVGQIIDKASAQDPRLGFAVRRQMGHAYVEYLGAVNQTGRKITQLDFDPEIVKKIYGYNPSGQLNEHYGERMVQKLRGVNELIAKEGLNAAKITTRDIDELSGLLGPGHIKEFHEKLAKRIKAEAEAEKIRNNALYKLAKQGDGLGLDSGALPAAVMDGPSHQVDEVLASFRKFRNDDRVFRGDFMEHFFARYPSRGASDFHGSEFWDGHRLLDDIRKNPSLGNNIKKVVGDEMYNNIIAASRLQTLAQRVSPGADARIGGGAVMNSGGVKWYLAPIQYAGDKIGTMTATALYRAGKLAPALRDMARKEVSREQYERNMQGAVKNLMATATGAQAMLQTGKYDPEWGRFLQESFGTLPRGTEQYEEEFGKESPAINIFSKE